MTSIIDASSATEGVSLAEVQRHLRITDNDQAVEVERVFKAARDFAERYAGRTFRSTVTRTLWFPEFPSDPIALPWPPVASVSSVDYYDSDGNDTNIASSNYRLENPTDNKAYLHWDEDFSTPETQTRPDAVRIAYVTGGTIPPAAKHAILMLAELFWGGDEEGLSHLRSRALEDRAKDLLGTLDAQLYA